ncbi:hypothetical protein OG943_40835 [Amycolatopsis sp. NBC_00345]|uniref:hypothetical protein n=1 Tax=Amycolatopsis sp. NBC_00345 TaxID=2975955 RepID=UPI002E2749A5
MTVTEAQIKALQNDPYVTEGTKQSAISAYHRLGPDGADEAYEQAQVEHDSHAQDDKANRDETVQSEKTLDAQQGPAPGGVGVKKSDEVLDLAKPALDFFSRWADQVWNKMPDAPPEKIDSRKDIWDKFAENADLDFRKFLDDAEGLANARQTLDGTRTDATNAVTTLFHDWKGDGAEAAKAQYEQRIQPSAQDLLDQIDGAAKLIPETMMHIYTALKTKVDEVLKLRVDEVATAPLYLASQVVEVARGKVDSKDKLLDIAQWLDSACPGNNLYDRLQDEDCGLNDENKDYAIGAAKQWLNGSFSAEFGQRYDSFKGLCQTATDTITTHFQTLSRFMEGCANSFSVGGTGSGGGAVAPDVSTMFAPLDGAGADVSTGTDGAAMSVVSADGGGFTAPGGVGVESSTGTASADTGASDEMTTASASLGDLGAHVLDPDGPPQHDGGPGAEQASTDGQLGAAPGGLTIDPLGVGQPTGAMPDGTSGFGGMGMGSMGGGLGSAPGGGDQQRAGSQHRVGDDVFEPRGSGSRISGSLDDESERPTRNDGGGR